MFRSLYCILLLVIGMSSHAESITVDADGLSTAQIAELKANVARQVASAASASAPGTAIEQVTAAATWGTQASIAASGFAKALGVAAKELNLSINDFLKSPAGILTASVIIWKVFGSGIYGLFFLTIGLIVLRVLYIRLFTDKYVKVEYKWFGGLITGTKVVRIPKSVSDLREDGEWLTLWVIIIALGILLAVGRTFF